MQKRRRVVTGEVDGRSVFASDREIAPIAISHAPGLAAGETLAMAVMHSVSIGAKPGR